MCTYCTTTNYRKIYENHIGVIPKDSDGRTYEIHHIDGNHSNNDPSNLKVVTLQEHYNIHYTQGDYGGCSLMAIRMNLTPIELSHIRSKAAFMRVNNGTHPFLGNKITTEERSRRQAKSVDNGTHPFLGGEIQRKKANERIKDGTHHFLSGEMQRKNIQERFANGTHPTQIKVCCIYCKTITGLNMFSRYHGDKCKQKN